MSIKQNWFDTLNEALQSENLLHTWDGSCFLPIQYGETRRYWYDDGSKYGITVSIFRDNGGRYERPVHYGWHGW